MDKASTGGGPGASHDASTEPFRVMAMGIMRRHLVYGLSATG